MIIGRDGNGVITHWCWSFRRVLQMERWDTSTGPFLGGGWIEIKLSVYGMDGER